jgi:NAD(P)-dependent dehydrogenase (short-subunit alcohol dehydrogenase family)
VSSQSVVVITGASQGTCAGLVVGYRRLGYAFVANSRNVTPSDDPMVLAVAGDIANPVSANASSTPRWSGSDRSEQWPTTPASSSPSHSPSTPTRTMTRSRSQSSRLFRGFACCGVRDAQRPVGVGVTDPRRAERRNLKNWRSSTRSTASGATPSLPATYAALAKRHPLGRVGEIDDVVKAVLYRENSPFVTGEILHVDGGQSAGH